MSRRALPDTNLPSSRRTASTRNLASISWCRSPPTAPMLSIDRPARESDPRPQQEPSSSMKALAAIHAGVMPMQTTDVRDARFYVVDERNPGQTIEPLGFDEAFRKANDLSDNGG